MRNNLLNNHIEKYEENEKRRIEKISKIFCINEKDKSMTNLKHIEKNQITGDNIFNYYKNKHFIEQDPQKTFLFLTYTINPKYYIKNEVAELEIMEIIKNQNIEIEKAHHEIIKNIKELDYIKVKELTKKGNIHLHIIYKIEPKYFNNFISTILNKKEQFDILGLINIKGTYKDYNKLLNNKNFKLLNISEKSIIFNKNISEQNMQTIFKSGNFLEIEPLQENQENQKQNIISYLLKYIQKNQESTKKNIENKEHKIFKLLKIKKITSSNFIKNDIKKEFLYIYYSMKRTKQDLQQDLIYIYFLAQEHIKKVLAEKEKKIFSTINREKDFDLFYRATKESRENKNDRLSQIFLYMKTPKNEDEYILNYHLAKLELEQEEDQKNYKNNELWQKMELEDDEKFLSFHNLSIEEAQSMTEEEFFLSTITPYENNKTFEVIENF
ncbi:MAG: hypothetical protein PHF17_00840 [Arcobacteraceae bacterium]|nr:hypothetical protein [Arcobacteraceae bacterium]